MLSKRDPDRFITRMESWYNNDLRQRAEKLYEDPKGKHKKILIGDKPYGASKTRYIEDKMSQGWMPMPD